MLNDPLAYLLTWTTYGTWLPGDDRGWVKPGHGHQSPNDRLHKQCQTRMKEPEFVLACGERAIVEQTVQQHCEIRQWHLWTVNCRTNHVHVVLSADEHPDVMVTQFKAWCTRRLKQYHAPTSRRERWWTEGASTRYINDEDSLSEAIVYVRDRQ